MSSDDIAARKSELRRRMVAMRRQLAKADGADAAVAFLDHARSFLGGPGSAVVAGYWPVHGELDVRPLLAELKLAGRRIALPVVVGPARPLIFRIWHRGIQLVPGALGTSEPPPDAEIVEPSVLLIPLLAFDRRKNRLGYGGGHYDQTLAALRARGKVLAVGVAFASQEVPEVPVHDDDQILDAIITEQGVL